LNFVSIYVLNGPTLRFAAYRGVETKFFLPLQKPIKKKSAIGYLACLMAVIKKILFGIILQQK
jgi:hypothetical protein